jgi:hypothetical protein
MELRLTADDYNLLLQVTSLSPQPEYALRAGVVDGMILRFEMEPEVGSELMVDIMNATLALTDRRQRQVMERLVRKLRDTLTEEGLGFAEDPVGLIRRHDSFNRSAQPDLAGFSPLQVRALLGNDWSRGTPGLQLRDDVPAELLAASDTLFNAQHFLAALETEGVRATAAGNLNRAFVKAMTGSLRWPEGYAEGLARDFRVINEQDMWPLNELRLVLELAELIECGRGRFELTTLGRDLVRSDRAGALMVLLFETTFRNFNLGYRDRLPDLDEFQGTIAYPLAVLARQPAGWRPYRKLVPDLLLPPLPDLLPQDGLVDYQDLLVGIRLMQRLEAFGLIACRYDAPALYLLRRIEKFRRTALFDHFLAFDLG